SRRAMALWAASTHRRGTCIVIAARLRDAVIPVFFVTFSGGSMRHGVDSDLDIGVLYRQRQPVVAPLSLRGEPTLRYRQRQAVSRSCPALLRRHEPQNAVVVRGGRAATVPIARGE